MKTAEDWIKKFYPNLTRPETVKAFIKEYEQIQQDARHSALSEAAKICDKIGLQTNYRMTIITTFIVMLVEVVKNK